MKLTINLDKTKAIVFSKGYTQDNKLPKFLYNGEVIEFTKSYKYLGVEFQQNSKFKDVIKMRILKAQNAIYAINRACSTECTSSIHTRKKLFESKVFPILTYGCAIWGTMTNNRLKFQQDGDIIKENIKTEFNNLGIQIQDIRTNRTNKSLGSFSCPTYDEKLFLLQSPEIRTKLQLESPPFSNHHHKIETFLNISIKKLLGIKKCANNSLTRMHIGWKPISISMWMAAVKYWLRTHQPTDNLLLEAAYKEMHTSNSQWKDSIQHILCSNGMQQMWEFPLLNNMQGAQKYIKTRLLDIEIQKSLTEITESKKISKILKYITIDTQTNELPNYHNLISDPIHKKTITKLRTHTHCLQTETGSYTNETDINKYNCPKCSMKVPEDAAHFLLICPWNKYVTSRASLINHLEAYTTLNRFTQHTALTKALLDCELGTPPPEKLQNIYSIIHKMYKLREKEPWEVHPSISPS